MENNEKYEVLRIFTKELIDNVVLYSGTYNYNRGIKGYIESTHSNDLISYINQRISERTEELREMYDNRPLPVDVFRYPDYKAEEKVFNDIVDKANGELLRKNVVNYFVETNRALFQMRHLILWNLGSIAKELNIELNNGRTTLLMATDVIINKLANIDVDTNRKDRLLTYDGNYMNMPEVKNLLTEIRIIDLLGE
jgi:hypothetical protein